MPKAFEATVNECAGGGREQHYPSVRPLQPPASRCSPTFAAVARDEIVAAGVDAYCCLPVPGAAATRNAPVVARISSAFPQLLLLLLVSTLFLNLSQLLLLFLRPSLLSSRDSCVMVRLPYRNVQAPKEQLASAPQLKSGAVSLKAVAHRRSGSAPEGSRSCCLQQWRPARAEGGRAAP